MRTFVHWAMSSLSRGLSHARSTHRSISCRRLGKFVHVFLPLTPPPPYFFQTPTARSMTPLSNECTTPSCRLWPGRRLSNGTGRSGRSLLCARPTRPTRAASRWVDCQAQSCFSFPGSRPRPICLRLGVSRIISPFLTPVRDSSTPPPV